MGCDIHALVEVRIRDGWWVNAGEVYIDRDYELFAVLADVRNDRERPLPFVQKDRGIPPDATYAFRGLVDSWGEDGHSAGYVTLGDLNSADLQEQIEEAVLPSFMAGGLVKRISRLVGVMDARIRIHRHAIGEKFPHLREDIMFRTIGPDDARLCFVFDN